MHSKLPIQVVVAVIICLSFVSIQPVLAQDLPADSVVNKTFSLYEPYKNLVTTASVTIIALLITVIYLLININKRRQTERLLQRRNEELIGVHEELSAQEEELRQNFSELYLNEEQIRQLAYYDPLTGLANRTLLTDLITRELAAASDYGSKGALIFLDIDNFKLVNDTYGHSWGDKLLVDIGGKLSALVGTDGVVARLGGDELIVFFPGGGDREFITEFADKIMKLFEQSITVNQHSFQVTASAGVVMYPDDGSCIDELLRNADTAMYSAKNSGKRNYKFFDKSMFEAVVEKAGMEASLRQAIVNNELIVHYQPQFNMATGRVEGFESLLRWASREYGLVTPLKFIPLAEETGMIVSIGKWVLQTACVFNQKLFAAGHGRLCTAVNISVVQLIEDDFVEMVAGVLAETGLPPECLELEITESVLMERFEENVRKLGELRRMGVRIALDDFGSGYSSLTYLKKLPITMLKMDKAFIDDITMGGVDAAITGSIIELAHQMGLTVVAEGVETEIQFNYLRQEKCDIIQGYFISRPLPPAEFINELQTCFQRSVISS